MPTDKDVWNAYVAGLFDGEGSVSIRKWKKTFYGGYYVCATIANTHKETLEIIKLFYPRCRIYTRESDNIKHKVSYQLVIGNRDEVYKFLNDIYEYTIIKKERIELATKCILETDNALREDYFLEMKRLNKRGIPRESTGGREHDGRYSETARHSAALPAV